MSDTKDVGDNGECYRCSNLKTNGWGGCYCGLNLINPNAHFSINSSNIGYAKQMIDMKNCSSFSFSLTSLT